MAEASRDARVCSACGAVVIATGTVCSACGTSLESAPAATHPDLYGDGERGIGFEEEAPSEWPHTQERNTDTEDVEPEDGGTIVIECGVLDATDPLGGAPKDVRVRTEFAASLVLPNAAPIALMLRTGSDRFILGRARQQCDAVITDARVSRAHMAISARDGRAFVEDLGSLNGTFVNGERIEGPRELHDGDRIRLGRTEFEFQLQDAN